jgi:hypothetical protein
VKLDTLMPADGAKVDLDSAELEKDFFAQKSS